MIILHDIDMLDQATIFRRLLVPRLLALAAAALVIGIIVPGFSSVARVGSVTMFLLPAAVAWAVELRRRHRVKKVVKSS